MKLNYKNIHVKIICLLIYSNNNLSVNYIRKIYAFIAKSFFSVRINRQTQFIYKM